MDYTKEQYIDAVNRAYEAGDIDSANELAAKLEEIYPPSSSVTPVPDPAADLEPQSTLLQRSGDVLESRTSSIRETLERPSFGIEDDKLSLSAKLIRVTGDVVGGAGEIAGDAILTGLEAITPDAMVAAVEDAGQWLANSEAGRIGLRLASESMEEYEKWKNSSQENEDTAELLEAYFNIGIIAAPGPKGVITRAGTTLETTGGNLSKGVRAKIKGERRDKITAMLDPETKIDIKDLDVTDLTQKVTYNPKNPYTIETIDILTEGKDIDPSKTYTWNAKKVQEAIEREGSFLQSRLAGETVVLDKANVIRQLDTAAQSILDTQRLLKGNPAKTMEKVFSEAVRLIQEGDGSLVSLLQARKSLDKFIGEQKTILEPSELGATELARKAIGKTINDIVDKNATNVDVKESLRKQSALFQADEILTKKRNSEGRTILSRFHENIGQFVPKTALAQAATAGAAGYAVYQFWPLLTTAAVVGTVFGAGKIAMSKPARALVYNMIKDSGAAIKEAGKKGMDDVAEQIKADRLVLLHILNESPVEEEEEE